MSDIAGINARQTDNGIEYEFTCHFCKCTGTFSEIPDNCPYCHTEVATRKGRENKYTGYHGKEWSDIRANILKRDDYCCQDCGVHQEDLDGPTKLQQSLHVHHIVPTKEFDTYAEANQPSNLKSLCQNCHIRAEHGDGGD